MALILCPECGKEISDKAKACPNCGMPLSEEMQGTFDVIIKREYQFYLINPALNLLVDGEDEYKVKNGESIVVPMTSGEHT